MGRVSPKERKPRLSFQVDPEDKEAIDQLMRHLPNHGQSQVLRSALRLGLAEIVKDQLLIGTIRPPTIPESLSSGSGKSRARPGR